MTILFVKNIFHKFFLINTIKNPISHLFGEVKLINCKDIFHHLFYIPRVINDGADFIFLLEYCYKMKRNGLPSDQPL